MKSKWINFALACGLALGVSLTSCKDTDAVDPNRPIKPVKTSPTAFDIWLRDNYLGNYNIDFKYKMEDIERDLDKNLIPASLYQSMRMAKVVRHVWLGSYDEVAGKDFMRSYSPRILSMIGSASFNGNGTITLATAEAGLKVVLYRVNELEPSSVERLNDMFFHTMHHEFAHILHQNVKWAQEYNLISAEGYSPSAWHNRSFADAAKLGFISQYAGSQAREDIAEVTARYITNTPEDWKRWNDVAGDEGKKKLEQKINIMKDYMRSVWHIDMDQLKEVCRRRGEEAVNLNYIEESWKPLLSNELRAFTPLKALTPEAELQRQEIVRILMSHPEALAVSTNPKAVGGGEQCQIITQFMGNTYH